MSPDEAATTLLLRGKSVEFPASQAERMLKFQKETGFNDYKEPSDEPEAVDATADPTPETNADNGQPGAQVDKDPDKRKGTKAGG